MTVGQWGQWAGAVLAAVLMGGASVPVAAQSAGGESSSLRAGRVSVAGGVSWTGGYGIGDATADLRGNAAGASAPPFTLFRASTAVDGVAGVDARVTWTLTRSLAVEGAVGYARPRITTSITGDPELLADTTLDQSRLAQYTVDLGATWQVPVALAGGKLRPFVAGGGGYLRQLYDERTLVETGSRYYAGGGVRYFFRGGDGTRRAMGLHGDVRMVWRKDGVEFEGRTRRMPAVALLLFTEL